MPSAPTKAAKQSGTAAPSQQTPVNTPSGPGKSWIGAIQRATLHEEDPNDSNGRSFVGSAIWRTELVSPGSGQPQEVAIRVDVEILDRELMMTLSVRRNTDKAIPATHTVDILFRLPRDFAPGAIANVPGITMRQSENSPATALAGHAVKVTDTYYLIGLSSLEADREKNMLMLKERAWFDIPIVYSNKRRALLALGKGSSGDRAFAEAFAAWRQ
jgi:hypothetical protein